MPSDTDTIVRSGLNRKKILKKYNKTCQDCGEQYHEPQLYKLHTHHIRPLSEGGPDDMDNVTLLCRDCHIKRHSDSEFNPSLVRRLSNTLAQELEHKSNNFSKRVASRARRDTILEVEDEDSPINLDTDVESDIFYVVEGILQGDHYDSYFVDTDQPFLAMCSCYTHAGGGRRARQLCTHVGAAIVYMALLIAKEEGEDAALQFIESQGKELNERAEEHIQRNELLKSEIGTLDIAEEFSESWADRARRQALKMTKYGREWKCYGGECQGCEVTLTSEGYRCDSEDKCEKFPCPGKLGAYILENTDQYRRKSPGFPDGTVFNCSAFINGMTAGKKYVSTRVDDEERVVEFQEILPGSGEVREKVMLEYPDVVRAIVRGNLTQTSLPNHLSISITEGEASVSITLSDGANFDVIDAIDERLHTGDRWTYIDTEGDEYVFVVIPTEERFNDAGGTSVERLTQDMASRYVTSAFERKDWDFNTFSEDALFVLPNNIVGKRYRVTTDGFPSFGEGEYIEVKGVNEGSGEVLLTRLRYNSMTNTGYFDAVDANLFTASVIRGALTEEGPESVADVRTKEVKQTDFTNGGDEDDGNRVKLKTRYEVLDEIKSLEYRWWDGRNKTWDIPLCKLPEYVDELAKKGVSVWVSTEVQEKYEGAFGG